MGGSGADDAGQKVALTPEAAEAARKAAAAAAEKDKPAETPAAKKPAKKPAKKRARKRAKKPAAEKPAKKPAAEKPAEEAAAPPALLPLNAIETIPGHVNAEGLGQPVLDLERLQALEERPTKEHPRPPWVDASGGLPAVRQAIQVIQRIRCPACRATLPDLRCERGGDLRYYRCKVCVDMTTGNYTRFRVKVEG